MNQTTVTGPRKGKVTGKRVLLGIAALLGMAFVGVLSYQIYLYHNPQLKIDYQTYEPTYLPLGLKTTHREIRAETPNALLWFWPPKISTRLYINDHDSSISFSKVDKDYDFTGPCQTNFVNTDCAHLTTPAKKHYIKTNHYHYEDKKNLISQG